MIILKNSDSKTMIKKSQIINNLLATQAGNVLDATQGKALKDLIDQINTGASDWSYIGSATGLSQTVSLPEIYHELLVMGIGKMSGNDNVLTCYVLKSIIDKLSDTASLRSGWGFGSTENLLTIIVLNKTTIKLGNMRMSSQNLDNSGTIFVYCR